MRKCFNFDRGLPLGSATSYRYKIVILKEYVMPPLAQTNRYLLDPPRDRAGTLRFSPASVCGISGITDKYPVRKSSG